MALGKSGQPALIDLGYPGSSPLPYRRYCLPLSSSYRQYCLPLKMYVFLFFCQVKTASMLASSDVSPYRFKLPLVLVWSCLLLLYSHTLKISKVARESKLERNGKVICDTEITFHRQTLIFPNSTCRWGIPFHISKCRCQKQSNQQAQTHQ